MFRAKEEGVSRVVFVLGAGASADAKAPLCSNFMDKAWALLRGDELSEEDRQAFRLVFKAREALKASQSKAALNLADLEVLFGAFEMAHLFGRLGTLSATEVEDLPRAMRTLIARTVERSMEFPVLASPPSSDILVVSTRPRRISHFPAILPPTPYEEFTQLLRKIAGGQPNSNVSVLTFNYDVGLDYALYFAGVQHSYGLDDAEDAKIDFLKLHGSLNWGRCSKCDGILALGIKQCMHGLPITNPHMFRLDASKRLGLLSHCDSPVAQEPEIVPPTWNKGTHHTRLERAWKKAAAHLSEAECIFVIGYSLPPTDEFFRYLYALGSIGEGWLQRITVFNPDPEVGQRFRGLLGPLAATKFTSPTNDFAQAISYLNTLEL
jgi:NAD-dependent SIR2 family protein deacetylase